MRKNNKGFTLAELLIVVAIIAVLVAIAIPVFTNSLEKAQQATDAANIRAAYAEAMVKVVDTGSAATATTSAAMKTGKWDKFSNSETIGNTMITSISKTEGKAEAVYVSTDGTVSFSAVG